MDLSKLAAQVKPEEGCRLLPYLDTKGKWTIGWGHNLSDQGITQAQADWIFHDDLMAAVNGVAHALPWTLRLDDVRQRVLVDVAFNTGIGGLIGFHHMLASLQVGDYVTAARELLDSEAARDLPGRYQVLAEMLRTGNDPA